MKLAEENYDTWGHWIVECETIKELAEKFRDGTYKDLAAAVELAKIYADYADDIKATGDW